jgi:hypothetical protein
MNDLEITRELGEMSKLNHCFTLNKCMIVVTTTKVTISNHFNARTNMEFDLEEIKEIYTDNENKILYLNDYKIYVEPASTFLIPEIINTIKRQKLGTNKKVRDMFDRGLLSVSEYNRILNK